MAVHPVIESVTADLCARSRQSRAAYLARMGAARDQFPPRRGLSCGNLAHGFAAATEVEKDRIRSQRAINIGIVTAYNDMLSAHQPLAEYPARIKAAALAAGGSAQVAGGVPAMCDGVTQGQPGMEMSLFSRDVIALATAVSLSHNLFDAIICLGVCDKIVPGMLMGALQFGYLPMAFIPAGPMPSGISNAEKARVRQRHAEGKADEAELLDVEAAAYHGPGTCTFHGTANTNQLITEVMGLQLPGAAFVAPADPLRPALVDATVSALIEPAGPLTLAEQVNEAAVINAVVALLASGGSTNHTLHLVAMARAAGIRLQWEDFARVARVVPLLMRVYPNGEADINDFQRAGGTGFLVRELRAAGLLQDAVQTLAGPGLAAYEQRPVLTRTGALEWQATPAETADPAVLRPIARAFAADGGLRMLDGNLGRSVIKISAVKPEHRRVRAPCAIFHDQSTLKRAFERGELDRDVIVVVRFQGPQANGMPELHQLTPCLSVLQDRGHRVALVTDGRMSGASGKVPAAIHLSPEAEQGGAIARLCDGDLIELDAEHGTLDVLLPPEELLLRDVARHRHDHGALGRSLFAPLRAAVGPGEEGASIFLFDDDHPAGAQA